MFRFADGVVNANILNVKGVAEYAGMRNKGDNALDQSRGVV